MDREVREQFVERCTLDMAEYNFDGLEALAADLAGFAETQRPTPLGSTELWGTLMQRAVKES